MGAPVPADDLPPNVVPASDLPSSAPAHKANPVTGTKPVDDAGGAMNYVPAVPVAETALALGSGTAGSVAGGFAGLAGSVLPGPDGQGAHWTEQTRQALSYEPRTAAGRKMTEAVSMPGEIVSKGAKMVGERGAQVSPLLGAIGETSVEALPTLLGARSALKAGAKPELTPKQERAAAARDAGLRLTPDEMGAGSIASGAASIAGEPRLGKLISKKNQPVWNNLIAEDLGLEKDTRLSRDVTEDIRSQEGNAYAAMRKAGQVVADDTYRLDLKAAIADLEGAAADFEHRREAPLRTVVDSLMKKESFDANSAVSEIINLRKDAKKAFKQGDAELGRGSLQAAEALENMLDRHVAKMSQMGQMDAEAMQAFKAARVRIAKSYAADKAMDPATGDINPQAYAKMLRERVPLTGGAQQVGEMAEAFPRSAQNTRNLGATGPSFWDAVMALGKRELPLLFARPGVREIMASRPGQAMMDPRTNLSAPTLGALGVSQAMPPIQEKTR